MALEFDPLPTFWYVFFGIVEPISTLAGAYHAILKPTEFYHDLIPRDYKRTAGFISSVIGEVTGGIVGKGAIPDEAKMGLAQLGSCYLLLAMLSAFFFPTVRSTLLRSSQPNPAAAEKIITATLLALGIADWIHILITLHFLPPVDASFAALQHKVIVLARNPQAWNPLLFGNVAFTLALFGMRSLWLAGVGRQSSRDIRRKRD